jgi:hypothetical protein
MVSVWKDLYSGQNPKKMRKNRLQIPSRFSCFGLISTAALSISRMNMASATE